LAHEVIELVRPALTPHTFEQLLAPMDQDRHMRGKQQREFPFERPAAVGFEVEPVNEQPQDLFKCTDKLLAHDALPSSRRKVCTRAVKAGLRGLVSESFWKPGQSEKTPRHHGSRQIIAPI